MTKAGRGAQAGARTRFSMGLRVALGTLLAVGAVVLAIDLADA